MKQHPKEAFNHEHESESGIDLLPTHLEGLSSASVAAARSADGSGARSAGSGGATNGGGSTAKHQASAGQATKRRACALLS